MIDPGQELQRVFVIIAMMGAPLMIAQWVRAAVIARKDPERSNGMLNALIATAVSVVWMLLFGAYFGLIPA
jgi:ABC-type phosphate transport system permease subunit